MKKWMIRKLNKENAVAVSQRYSLPMLIAMLLDIRGITGEKEITDFLYAEELTMDPFEIKDMDKAAERVQRAVESGERICIYGDFDADGVTSTALLYSYLSDIGADVTYYIPSRETEGYGMNDNAITKIYEQGTRLIVTVDNGVAAYDEVAYANSLGMDVVVTDHHTVPERIPEAVAVVDPHRPDCNSSFKELCGVGVALKLVQAIEGEYCDTDSLMENYSDLAALGTIGDLVPLVGENRVIAKQGLYHINNGDRLGISAIIENAGLSGKKINSGNVSFNIVPRINAVGRLGLSKSSVALLMTEDEDFASDVAEELSEDNVRRQAIEKEILDDINEMVIADPSLVWSRVIVICGEGWHKGVVGIVASRIKEIYSKPAIIISVDDDICRASGRSVKGFELNRAVEACCDLLVQYGGHPMAVGLSLTKDNIPAFIERINSYAAGADMPSPALELDCKLNPGQLSVPLVSSLSLLEPFGVGNPTPIFGLYNMTIRDIKEVGGAKHLRLVLARGDTTVTAMRFSRNLSTFPYLQGDVVDLAVTLDINIFNNTENLSVVIRDIKFSDIDEDDYISSKEIFESFCRGDEITREQALSLLPDRNEFAVVYRFLKASGGFSFPFDILLFRLSSDISYGKLRVILECMNELGLIRIYEGLYDSRIEMREVETKVNLSDSLIIGKLKEACL